MNEFTESECLPNLKIFGNLKKPLTRKSMWENVLVFLSCFSYAIQEKFTDHFAIHVISVFRMKVNVEFTRQAVNFSI